MSPFLGIYNSGRAIVTALGKYSDKSSKTIAEVRPTASRSSKTVSDAGPVAAAFAAAIKGSVTCVDKSTGVLLLFTTKDADGKTSSSFTGDEVRRPSDSDFTPPATPSSIPSYTIPGGG